MSLSLLQTIILAIMAPPALAIYLAILWSFRHDFSDTPRIEDEPRRPWGWDER